MMRDHQIQRLWGKGGSIGTLLLFCFILCSCGTLKKYSLNRKKPEISEKLQQDFPDKLWSHHPIKCKNYRKNCYKAATDVCPNGYKIRNHETKLKRSLFSEAHRAISMDIFCRRNKRPYTRQWKKEEPWYKLF